MKESNFFNQVRNYLEMEKEIKIYEKCNMNKAEEGKKVWEIVKPADYKNISDLSNTKILDIGCGSGEAFSHFQKKFGTSNFKGFELKSLSQIKEKYGKIYFEKKIRFDTRIDPKFLETINDKFDLIILSKALHYKDIDNPRCVILECRNLLTKDGLIFIKSKRTEINVNGELNPGSNRRIVDEKTFKKWTKNLKELRKITDDSGFLYFLGK